jgi:hypothetical protein
MSSAYRSLKYLALVSREDASLRDYSSATAICLAGR